MKVGLLAGLSLLAAAKAADALKKPNIVFIIADDQDARQDSIATMPAVQRRLVDQGTQFTRFYAPISVCCPSRSSFFRAQAAHNTNITSVAVPYGGWEVFVEKGYNGHYLPSFLQEAGYSTYYTGKLMNGNTVANHATLSPEGWTDFDLLLDPQTYNYWNASFGRKGADDVVYHDGEYSTDVVRDKGLAFLDDALADPDSPFFLGIAPIAPHSHIAAESGSAGPTLFQTPRFHPRHAHLFTDVTLNTSRESFNPEQPTGASWVRRLPQLNETHIEYIEEFYRARLRALAAVDELVEAVVERLERAGVLEETFVVYTSDNGFEANGGHRRHPGKTLPYEEDINVPLVVRGPLVPSNLTDHASVYSLADLGATILHLAGASPDFVADGTPLPLTAPDRLAQALAGGPKAHHLAEYWVEGVVEGKFASGRTLEQKYRAVRVVEEGLDLSYAVWCTGEHEIYDLRHDPDQVRNLALAEFEGAVAEDLDLGRLRTRLDALLLVLKACVGEVCNKPWKSVFPGGGVHSLRDALSAKYDAYFEGLPKVKYVNCDLGYHRQLEHPFWHDGLAFEQRAGDGARFVIQA